MKLYSYCLRYDNGAAPIPFWGICTLVIYEPAIQRTAKVADWIEGYWSIHDERNRQRKWIEELGYTPNRPYGEPQLMSEFTFDSDVRRKCVSRDFGNDYEDLVG
jgi:hypothetical protein